MPGIFNRMATWEQEIIIPGNNSDSFSFEIPSGTAGKTIHIICEVTVNGTPGLTCYRRIIIHAKE
jgi:hypothetical protein